MGWVGIGLSWGVGRELMVVVSLMAQSSWRHGKQDQWLGGRRVAGCLQGWYPRDHRGESAWELEPPEASSPHQLSVACGNVDSVWLEF